MAKTLMIGTRGSMLAMAQTNWVADQIRQSDPSLDVRIERISTQGDRRQDVPLPAIGGKGLFTAELEEALRSSRIDLAVHSAKDLPTEIPADLRLAAVPVREDPRDALITGGPASLDTLPNGAVLGTSSTRRRAQLRLLRPDFQFTTLRGNVDTRIKKVRRGDCDATLLATAGLNRSGLANEATQILDIDAIVPAPGQGCLALQTRDRDGDTIKLLEPLHHAPSAVALTCERAIVAALQGGCFAPIGALVLPTGREYKCHALVAAPDGSAVARAVVTGPIDTLAQRVVADLEAQGAERIIADCRDAQQL